MSFVNLNDQAENSKNSKNTDKKNLISGIFRIKTRNLNFDMLTINSDDSSIVNRFWDDNFEDFTLEKWSDWTSQEGIHIDVGAHTGLFTLAALKSNKKNIVVAIEPFDLNYHRIITNLRLNNFDNTRVNLFNLAASNQNKEVKFEIKTPWSYLSKGGKISNQGINVKAIKLDSINFNPSIKIVSLKIDTEGEDFSVLEGSKNLIKTNMPNLVIETRPNNIVNIINLLNSLGYNNIYDKFNKKSSEEEIYKFENNKNVKDIFCEKS